MSEHPMDPTGQTTVLVVSHVLASVEHYTRVLGFDEDFTHGDPPTYAGLVRGPVMIHLQASDVTHRAPGGGNVILYVRDAHAAHEALVARGARIGVPPASRDYGLIDFNVLDPDGNQLVYASEIGASDVGKRAMERHQ